MLPPASIAFLVFSLGMFVPLRAAQPLACGQTNECLWIEGNIRVQTVFMKSPDRIHRFEALTDGLLWRVKIFDTVAGPNGPFAYFEHGTDGESVYEVNAFNTNEVRGEPLVWPNGIVVTNKGPWKSQNIASATVAEGVIPPQSGSLSLGR